MSYFNMLQSLETAEYLTERIDKLGGPESYNHYAVGWAHAMNTPYQWTKQVASHWGGTRNGTIVHWPNGIKGKGEMRSQFHHIIDISPTILEAAGLPQPIAVNGIPQGPIEGVSMLYSFNDANAPDTHETQYFEIFCNRGIYHKGWTAVTKHRTPWASFATKMVPFDDDVWELYDTTKDWSQAHDLAKQMPEKLHELQRLWLMEAMRYKVLPLDDRMIEKLNPDLAGRPVLIKGKTQLLFGGMGRLGENCVLNLKNKSHSVTAEIVAPEKGANKRGTQRHRSRYRHGATAH
jgi:arylsulfatase